MTRCSLTSTLALSAWIAFATLPLLPADAHAAPCFAADGDGTYDQDGTENGVITVTATSTQNVPAAETPYECPLDIVINAGGQLIFEGNPATGDIVDLRVNDLTIEAGGAIHADGEGCQPLPIGGTEPGLGPDSDNICVKDERGAGGGGNDFGGAGGGGHGGRGGNAGVGAGGTTYGSATAPLLFGASGGNTGAAIAPGGAGGGVIAITAKTVVIDGQITANGSDGGGAGGRVTGGGAGGSIFVDAVDINGSGTLSATGGNAGGLGVFGGGGGGGRIAILYDTATMNFQASTFDVSSKSIFTPGDRGTVYVRDNSNSTVHIFHGFTFANEHYIEDAWFNDASALNQYCDSQMPADAAPSITATEIVLAGVIACLPSIESFSVTERDGGKLTLADNVSITVNGALLLKAEDDLAIGPQVYIENRRRGSNLTIDINDGDDQVWDNLHVEGAAEGRFIVNAAISLTVQTGSSIHANPLWKHLDALTLDAASSIHADAKGCDALREGAESAGRAPNCSNVCTRGQKGAGQGGNDFGPSGGGGHGGAGGAGLGAGGDAYESARDPRLFGASGGNTGAAIAGGGNGGGLIEIAVSGQFDNDGTITANGGVGGGNPGRVTGGGAGGTINIRSNQYTCTTGGSFIAFGGNGAEPNAPGGGGGRIAINVTSDSCAAAPVTAVTGATSARGGDGGTLGGNDGAVGSASVNVQEPCADPRLAVTLDRSARLVNASDALFILQAAVGTQCCSLCVCDVNGAQGITATDALNALKKAVGQPQLLACPVCS